jgi:hypothetical protein
MNELRQVSSSDDCCRNRIVADHLNRKQEFRWFSRSPDKDIQISAWEYSLFDETQKMFSVYKKGRGGLFPGIQAPVF